MRLRMLWLAGVAGFIFTLAGAQPARADHGDDRRDCGRKIDKQEYKLQREIHRHGYFSRQARREREKLLFLRRQCGYGYGWGRDRNGRDDDDRWRRDRDWRDDDRDYDWRRDRDYHRHDPIGCRHYDHRHDRRSGIYIWFNGTWGRRR